MKGTNPAHVSGMFDDRERGVFVPIDRVHALGGWTQAIVYSQLAYWHQKMRRPFYKTAANLAEELALGHRTVERAIAKLRELGVIETEVRKVKNTPTNHFAVNYARHDELVLATRKQRADSARMAESETATLAESMEAATLAESYTGEYIQESTPLKAPASRGHTLAFGEEKEQVAPQASPSVPNPPGSARPPLPRQSLRATTEMLISVYNSERGPLPPVKAANSERQRAIKRLLADCEQAGYDPVEVVRGATLWQRSNSWHAQKGLGFDNLRRNSNFIERYEKHLAERGPAQAPTPAYQPGQKLWHKAPWMREREAVTVDRSRAGGKVFVYRGDETSGPMIEVEAAHLTPRVEP